MRFSKKEILVSVVLIVVLFSYYLYSNAAWKNLDASFNPEREKLGIPLIETYFVENDRKDGWHNPDTTLPRHALKTFSVKTQSKTIEQDNFEFILKGKKATAYTYYHYNNNCFNMYLRVEGENETKLTCSEFNSVLKDNGLTFQLTTCNECSEK